jgi:hypothetical protein
MKYLVIKDLEVKNSSLGPDAPAILSLKKDDYVVIRKIEQGNVYNKALDDIFGYIGLIPVYKEGKNSGMNGKVELNYSNLKDYIDFSKDYSLTDNKSIVVSRITRSSKKQVFAVIIIAAAVLAVILIFKTN